ncbi:MAG: alpha/beta hydrolase [Alphaproteobacteria bacterium]|nr:alpha/beta hydrolase [Alphaproteobacteria bacterium]
MNAEAHLRPTVLRYHPPAAIWSLLEPARAAAEFGALPFASFCLGNAPRGDGHPVMVIPGFMGTDGSTSVLRAYLTMLGYEVYPWALGRNFGPRGDIEHRMVERANHISATHDCKVSLVGWSLGGIFARQIARDVPEAVRQVITMGSPFGSAAHGGTNREIAQLYELLSGDMTEHAPDHIKAHRRLRPPVPCTAIYSKTDGVAVWQVCVEEEGPDTDNIEVVGSHTGLGFNPLVLYAVADRLALPEDGWTPFDRSGMRALFYR